MTPFHSVVACALIHLIGLVEPAIARTLEHEAIIDAPVADVWDAFTTNDGAETWMVAQAEIDLRVGGDMRTSYNPKSNLNDEFTIVNRIISFEPQRMLSIQNVQAPTGFKHPELFQQTWSVLYFEPLGPKQTHVRIVGLNYGEGADWDVVYGHFKGGNAYVLDKLKQRFAPQAEASKTTAADVATSTELAPLSRFVGGQWVINSPWADGRPLHARKIWSWALNGRFLTTETFVTKPDGSEFQRYWVVYYWDAKSKQIAYHEYTYDGGITSGTVIVKDDDTLEYPTPNAADGIKSDVSQSVRFTDNGTLQWHVSIKDDAGQSKTLMNGEWKRQPLP
jgi:uncharacterized protein YndB with AHSA1/START domain